MISLCIQHFTTNGNWYAQRVQMYTRRDNFSPANNFIQLGDLHKHSQRNPCVQDILANLKNQFRLPVKEAAFRVFNIIERQVFALFSSFRVVVCLFYTEIQLN